MYSFVLVIVCLVTSIIILSVLMSSKKGRAAKNICFFLSLSVFLVSIVLFVGFDLFSKKVYISSTVKSSETARLATMDEAGHYLTRNTDRYSFLYVGEKGNKAYMSADRESTNVNYDRRKAPQATKESVTKEYYEEWLFLKGGIKSEERTEYEFIIPDEDSILYADNDGRAEAGP